MKPLESNLVWHFRSTKEWDNFILDQCRDLSIEVAERLHSSGMTASKFTSQYADLAVNPAASVETDGFFASILFMGPVFGEFILSVSRADAELIFAGLLKGLEGNAKDKMIGEVLSEILNQSAARRIPAFNQVFKRMTMSVPKVSLGRVSYRDVKSAVSSVTCPSGKIGVALYIDQMQTDLAEAHRELIAQLKLANQDLEKVNQKIKEQQAQLVQSEKMASLGLMAAGVAHEINNPLSFVTANFDALSEYVEITNRVIEGYSGFVKAVLRSQSGVDAGQTEKVLKLEQQEEIQFVMSDSEKLIEESRTGLDRIRRIVDGLRRFSRTEGKQLVSTQVNDEILNTLELLRNEIKYKCTIETNLQSVRELKCLPQELNQVFVNLVMNAVQAIGRPDGKIWVETKEDQGELLIRIRDNGSGMSPEVISKLFQPFFTTKPVGKGTGLGLAISYGIIERHCGRISVESEIGKGSCFEIRIPYPGQLKEPEALSA